MKLTRNIFLLSLLVSFSAFAGDFVIYDLTLYKKKPKNLRGIKKINIWYTHMPMPTNVKNEWIVDFEALPLSTPEEVMENEKTYTLIMDQFKNANPDAKVGWYATLPNRQYWPVITGNSANWLATNISLIPLSNQIDSVYPSLYTFYDDIPGWIQYANANIAEAQKYGKDVYVFLWPQYHNSNKTLGGQYIDSEFWRIQLETIMNSGANGIVIWGGWQQDWDDNAGWWLETQDFIKQNM